MKALLAAALIALPCSVLAQTGRPQPLPEPAQPQASQPTQPAQPGTAQPAPDAKADACGNFSMAQNAIYAAYIRLIAEELPDPAKVPGEAMKNTLEALYTKHVETARGGDIDAVRKATAYELFGMQIQRQPPADSTQERFCVLAKAPGREALMDTLACAVSIIDGPRKERPGAKETARAMMEKAAASIPAEANASDMGKLLYDSVARGMSGCY